MARFLLLLAHLFWLSGGAVGADGGRAVQRSALKIAPAAPADPAALRVAVARVLVGELHVCEATGRNDGPRIRDYQQAARAPAGSEWCAAFVVWVLEQAGAREGQQFQRNGWAAAWFPARRVIWRRGQSGAQPPQVGDVIGYAFARATPHHINHVGLIWCWGTGNAVATIEGNTNAAGSRTGQGVYQKWRLKSQVAAVADWITPVAPTP